MLVGRALGGRPGQRLMSRLGMSVSRHTLLRQVIRAAQGGTLTDVIRIVGVDDWAWSKGQSFGTILVDLERGEVVVVSRDRHGIYAEGARRGAPEAVQVADRFHLILNLRQAVERELAVQRPHLQVLPPSTPALPPAPTTVIGKNQSRKIPVSSSVWKRQAEAVRQGRQKKLELFQTIRRMQATGLKVSEIAKHLGINRRRIDKWVRLDTLPERGRMQPRPGMAESFRDYLRQRWDAGSRHGRTLFAEIQRLGYAGGFSNLAKLLSAWRQPVEEATTAPPAAMQAEAPPTEAPQLGATPSPAARQISPQVAAALLSKIRAELTLKQGEVVDTLKRQCPGFAAMRELVLGFRTILRVGKLATLQNWMERAQKTGIHALDRFVRTSKQDLRAVEATVTEPWSNGPVEGQINRLKTLKRQMYGRAAVELLRARLLPEVVFSGQRLHQT